jgi:hypothetical protein
VVVKLLSRLAENGKRVGIPEKIEARSENAAKAGRFARESCKILLPRAGRARFHVKHDSPSLNGFLLAVVGSLQFAGWSLTRE